MEEFFNAGGLPVVMSRLAERLDLNAPAVEGGTIGDRLEGVACYDDEVIRPLDNPLAAEGGIMVFEGQPRPRRGHHQAIRGLAAADAASGKGSCVQGC